MGLFTPVGTHTTYITYGDCTETTSGSGEDESDFGSLDRNKFIRFTQFLLSCASLKLHSVF